MDVLEAIKNRRSVRSFREDRDVEKEKLGRIIEAAAWAPSAGNMQAREFIVVRKKETREKLAEAALNQEFIAKAPVVIVVCANKRKVAEYGSRGESLYCIQDSAASVQNILLASFALGLGSCWVGAFSEQKVKSILNIPNESKPVALIPIGYSAEEPEVESERSTDVRFDLWQ